jgi:PadR family transcriptional regulator, regulatory protein PadR
MPEEFRLTMTSALILEAVGAGRGYGFDIMEATGLPSGTVYPALRRLEQLELVRSKWEGTQKALSEQRPARKYYKLTNRGEGALSKASERYSVLQRLPGNQR